MELFLSTFVNKVDRKGRVSVPATFRAALAKHRIPNQVVLIPSHKYDALEGAGSDHLDQMMEGINTLEQYSPRREELELIFAESRPLQLDAEGRIVVPDDLKSYAHIADEVTFVGLGATFQMWEPKRFDAYRTEVRDRARRSSTTLPPSPAAR